MYSICPIYQSPEICNLFYCNGEDFFCLFSVHFTRTTHKLTNYQRRLKHKGIIFEFWSESYSQKATERRDTVSLNIWLLAIESMRRKKYVDLGRINSLNCYSNEPLETSKNLLANLQTTYNYTRNRLPNVKCFLVTCESNKGLMNITLGNEMMTIFRLL